jgi:putative colanic acid biosynthesis glycosyltransferase
LNDLDGLKLSAESIGLSNGEFEHIIVDGNSTDGSYEYAIDLSSRSNTRVIKQRTHSIYGAFNEGLDESKGEYVIYLFCGDTMNIDTVKNLVKLYGQYDIIACSCTQRKDEGIKYYYRSERDEISVSSMSILLSSLIVKLDKYKIVSGYDDNFKISADVDCILKILKTACKIIYVDDIIVNMEEYGVSSDNYFKKIKEHTIIKYRHGSIVSAMIYIPKRLLFDFLIIPVWIQVKRALR